MRKNKRVSEKEVREALTENEVISNKLFDDPDNTFDSIDEGEDLNELLGNLDNITTTFREENENPFFYFLNMYSY